VSHPSAADLARATPVSRDRYVDLLRAGALVAVMLGHYLMAGVVRGEAHELVVTNTLVEVPVARLLTWVLQVMPIFFMVGGFSNATSLASLRRRAGDGHVYADFAFVRCRRLLEPTAAFVTFGVLAAALVEITGTPDPTVEYAFRLIGQPLWFIGIYLVVVAFAPAMLTLHERHGVRVVVVLCALVVLVDVARLSWGLTLVGYLNFVLAWLVVHQIGFFYADGRLLDRRVQWAMAVGGLTTAVVLVALLVYPVSMVSLPGEVVSNLAPPSVALLALAFGQIGVLMLLRDPVNRWLRRPRVWTAVVAANGVVMTAFLWHLTAIVAVNALVVQSGLPTPTIGSAVWWATRPLLLAAIVVVLAGLVAVFRRFEAPHPSVVVSPDERRHHRDGLAILGLTLAVVGVLGFSMTGFSGVTTLQTQELVVLPMTPFVNLALLLAGWWLVQRAARSVPSTQPAGGPLPPVPPSAG
jgi:hypothetical protein